jgi:NAD(P)-dependent dehydrogenase (short-subunit alcohol dehydrogenase family)
MTLERSGKVALVTGASKGIGAGVAKTFGRAGAHVAAAMRAIARGDAAGGRSTTVQCDLAQPAEIEAMVAETVATLGAIDILVNNAGAFEYRSFPAIDQAHFHPIFPGASPKLGLTIRPQIRLTISIWRQQSRTVWRPIRATLRCSGEGPLAVR